VVSAAERSLWELSGNRKFARATTASSALDSALLPGCFSPSCSLMNFGPLGYVALQRTGKLLAFVIVVVFVAGSSG